MASDVDEIPDYQVFEMEFLMNKHEYDGTIFNGSVNVYEKVRSEDLFPREFHKFFSADNIANKLLKDATIANVQIYDNGINLLSNPEHFYSLVLMDILSSEDLYDLSVDSIKSSVKSDTAKIIDTFSGEIIDSTWEDILGTTVPNYSKLLNAPLKDFDNVEIIKLCNLVEKYNFDVIKYVEIIDTVDLFTELAKMGATVYEATQKANSYYAIAEYNLEMINLLKDMRSKTEKPLLKIAINDIVNIYEGIDYVGLSVAKSTVESLLLQTTKYVATTLCSYVGIASFIWDLGTGIANLAFDVDDLNTGYLTVDAAGFIEEALRECMKSYESAFLSNRTVANAEKCRTAYKTTLMTQYYATNMMQKLGYSLAGNGSLLGIIKSKFGCTDYQTVVDVCDSTRNIIEGRYYTWVGLAQKTYKNLYGVSFDHAISAPVVEVSSVSFRTGNYTLFSNEGLCNPATAYPTNAVGRELYYSSNNPGVAVVGAYGNITAVGPGEATITATSENGKKATCKITVLPYDVSVVDGSYTIDKFTGGAEPADIPASLNGTTVTAIADGAFLNTSVTSVVIPSTVTSIGDSAFSGCTNLASISIPDSVTSMGTGYRTFYNCTSLTSVKIPRGATSIGERMFYGCTNLNSVTIPDSVTSVGTYAFYNCKSLKSVVIPDGVTTIEVYTFYGCASLESVIISDGAKSIGNYAFYNCSAIKELTIPSSVKIYNSSNTFGGCTNIEKVTLTKGTGSMHNYETSTSSYTPWYVSRNSIKEIIIEDGISNIGSYVFSGCTGLTSITIPDSVTSIGENAFYYCTSLESITIPDSVTRIGDDAFWNCSGIKELTMPVSAYYGINAFSRCTNIEKAILTKGTGTMENKYAYDDYTPWYASRNKIKEIVMEDGIANIGDWAFYNCTSLTTFTIPDSVTSIDEEAFYGCTNVKDLTMSASADYYSLENFVFESLTNLEKVTFTTGSGKMVDYSTSKTDDLIYYCATPWYLSREAIKEISFEEGITYIGTNAFRGISGITTVRIPNTVTKIGDYAFRGCTGITDVYFAGTEEEWNKIDFGSSNTSLTNATIHFLGEETGDDNEPEVDDDETTKVEFDISLLKPLRGTASIKSYKGEEYIAITMAEGKTMTGLYKDMVDGGTVELVDICGTIQNRANDYVAYQSQNKTNPVATMKITYADGTVETYPVVFELYEMEREISFNPAEKIKPIRGKVSKGEDAKGEYILVEMLEGQSSVGVYKSTTDGSTTATLEDAEGMFTEKENLYIFYGSQNTTNPEGRLTVTEADGSQKTYRIVFKMYEMDPHVNAAKGLRPVRGSVTFDDDGTIRIKMTSGQKSVGLYKTMANGATFKIVDENGRITNNPSSLMFYMSRNTANVTAKIIFTLPDGTTKEQKIIFDMGLEDNPDPLVYLSAVRGTVSYQNDGTEDYIEVKANALSSGVGLNKKCLVKYTITDADGIMTENDTRYYIYKSQNPDGVTANINFLQSDGSYKTYKVKFVF